MDPRIYTYKITFDEIPDWYWGVHKEDVWGDTYMGSPLTHSWKWDFYTPRKQILEVFEYSSEGWEEANKVEDRLIRPDLNNPLCLNEACGFGYSIESRRKGGQVSGQIWTPAKIEASRKAAARAREVQKERGIQIYGPDFEYYRRKGRLRRFGVKIDGVRIPIGSLSETFIEYHLLYGKQNGGYNNP